MSSQPHHTPLSKGMRKDRTVPVLNLCLPILVSSQKTTEERLSASRDVLLHFDFFKHAALIVSMCCNNSFCSTQGSLPSHRPVASCETTMTITVAPPFSWSIHCLSVVATMLYVPVWVSKLYTEGEAGVVLRCFFQRVGLQETVCMRDK